MVKKKFLKKIKNDFENIIKEKKILGIMLFGSYVEDMQTNRSDIDICIVAPEEDPSELFSIITQSIDIHSKKYDIKFFTELPSLVAIKNLEKLGH
ncbi:MAG: nucleotidyltransferase domain-containing protein [Promethearchaeota archaeon]